MALVTRSSFCAVRQPSSSVLTCGHPCDLSPTDCCIWGMRQKRVYQIGLPISDTHELRQRLVEMWALFQQSTVDNAINQCRKRLEACIHADGGHFEHLLWCCLHDIQVATQRNSPFQSHQRLEGNNIPSARRLSSEIHKVVRWQWCASSQSRLQFVLF